jgi:hypothetical protein
MWLTIILDLLKYLPVVAAGINVIHGETKTHATKTQMAMDALGISSAIAAQALPADSPIVTGVTQLVGAGISESSSVVAAIKGKAAPVALDVSAAAAAVIAEVTPQPKPQDVAASVVLGTENSGLAPA